LAFFALALLWSRRRSVLEGHDGRLQVSAGAEGGAVFQFVLPANIA
jgi:hypothetical protein